MIKGDVRAIEAKRIDDDVALATDRAPQNRHDFVDADLVRRKRRDLAFGRRMAQGFGM